MNSIIKINSPKQLSKQQQEFNKLIDLIEKRKNELTTINKKLEKGKRVISEHFMPLEMEFRKAKRVFVIELEEWFHHPKITKTEKFKIDSIIEQHLPEAMSVFPDDEQLLQIEKRLLSALDDEDDEDDEFDDLIDDFYSCFDDEPHQKKESKSQQQKNKAKEEQHKAETQSLGKMTKKLYTNLVKKLHPDREQDEVLRDEKTEIMKEITQAYNDNNIYALMQLHQTHMENEEKLLLDELGEDQIKSYIKLLKKQSMELQSKIEYFRYSFETSFVLKLMAGTDATIEKRIKSEMSSLKNRNALLESEMQNTKLELKSFKKYLKTIDPNPFRNIFDDDFPF